MFRLRSALAFVLLLAFPFCMQGQQVNTTESPRMAYHLSWDGQSALLRVTLNYTAANKDSTVFTFGDPNFGGQKEIFKTLQDITSTEKIKVTPAERKITVYHTGPGLKTISYSINGQLLHDPKRSTVNELFRPLLVPDLLYLVPQFFMINPVKHRATAATVQWDSIPTSLRYFISVAPGAGPARKQEIDLKKEEDVLILAGSGLVINTYKVHGIPYYAITSRKDTVNDITADLQPFFTRYFPGLRDFWKDNSGSYYYISVLPLLAIDHPWATGYSQKRGFVMRYSGKFGDEKKRVLAHETSHAWIGNNMQIGNDEFDNQWFGEGFNDYVMLINMVHAGIQDKAAFLDYINKDNLLAHYRSTVKNLPNDSIAPRFWTDKNVQTLPYKRGFIYAFYLDNQIRLASGGKHTIRDFLLALLKRDKQIHAENPAANLTLDDYVAAVSKFLPRNQVQNELKTNLQQGVPLDFRKVKLIKGFYIAYRDSIPVLQIAGAVDLKKIYKW
jgi:predicted metalloprotease with PDZ domain